MRAIPFASTAGGQRTCVRAAPASFEKFAAHFSNAAFGSTEPAEALPQVLVIDGKQSATQTFNALFCTNLKNDEGQIFSPTMTMLLLLGIMELV